MYSLGCLCDNRGPLGTATTVFGGTPKGQCQGGGTQLGTELEQGAALMGVQGGM